MPAAHISALILAGGKATRLGGIAKHEIVVDGKTIFERQVAVLAPRVSEIIVSAPRDVGGFKTVRDAVDGVGPLAGIDAGLGACMTPWLLVVAGDMPYLTAALVDQMIAAVPLAGAAPAAVDAIGVRVGDLPEPLLCVLHRRTRLAVHWRIANQHYKASGLLTDEDLRVRWLDVTDRQALRNVNSPEDL